MSALHVADYKTCQRFESKWQCKCPGCKAWHEVQQHQHAVCNGLYRKACFMSSTSVEILGAAMHA
eukprot:1143774-Pelagomonas_calceolata.AAC.7